MLTANTLTWRGEVLCALCKGLLTVHGCYQRHYRDESGKCHYGWVAQGYCGVCNKYPSLLPSFIMPYKHYEAAAIESVILESEEKESLSGCAADESTMRRWINQFKERGAQAVGWLLSALFTVYGRHISASELQNKKLLEQLARLVREYPARESDGVIGSTNIILTMCNYGFL